MTRFVFPVRRRCLVLGLTLAAPLFAAHAADAATCTFDDPSHTVSVALNAEDASLGRSGDELVILGGPDCGDATIANTTTVNVSGTPADETFRVTYMTGPMPGIDLHVDLGDAVVTDSLLVQTTAGRDWVTAGAGLVNVTPRDLDPEISFVDEQLIVESGDGDDILSGAGGAGTGAPLATAAIWSGGAGNDRITGGDGRDLVVPGPGDDAVDGGADNDGVSYTDAPAGVSVDFGTGLVTGGSGNDTLASIENVRGSELPDHLVGAGGDDGLHGEGGADVIDGRAGDDDLIGGAGNDTIAGGIGQDRVAYNAAPSGVVVDLAAGTATGGDGTDALSAVEDLLGSELNDVLSGTGGGNRIDGLGGPDTINGRGGDDAIIGGEDVDTATYANAPALVVVDLTAGTATGGDGNDGLVGIENVFGSPFDDRIVGSDEPNVLVGNAGADRIAGLGGDDQLVGRTGNDRLLGGDGSDTLTPGSGNDYLHGGNGRDLVTYVGAPNLVSVHLGLGHAWTGADGVDDLVAIEDVTGSAFSDHLTGNALPNRLTGLGGSDWLFGRAAKDQLIGGPGNDRMDGGAAFDLCLQGPGLNPIGWPINCP